MLPKDSLAGAELALSTSLSQKSFDLSIIIPTRNEVGNINPLVNPDQPGAQRDSCRGTVRG